MNEKLHCSCKEIDPKKYDNTEALMTLKNGIEEMRIACKTLVGYIKDFECSHDICTFNVEISHDLAEIRFHIGNKYKHFILVDDEDFSEEEREIN